MKFNNIFLTALCIFSGSQALITGHPPRVPPGSIKGKPLPPRLGKIPEPVPPRFNVPQNLRPQPTLQPDPLPILTRADDQQVVPDVFLNRQTNVQYDLMPTAAQNPAFTIDLINSDQRWRLYSNVQLNQKKVFFLELNRTDVPFGSGFQFQTIENSTGSPREYWESQFFNIRDPNEVSIQSVDDTPENVTIPDAGAQELDLAPTSDASAYNTTSPSNTTTPSSTASPSSTPLSSSEGGSLGASVGPYMVTVSYGVTLAILYTMM